MISGPYTDAEREEIIRQQYNRQNAVPGGIIGHVPDFPARESSWTEELQKHLNDIDSRVLSYVNSLAYALERFDGPSTTNAEARVDHPTEELKPPAGQLIGQTVDRINVRLNEFESICERINKIF